MRVYIHKLRKLLEVLRPVGGAGGVSLSIPRGEYRWKVSEPMPAATPHIARGKKSRIYELVAAVAGGAILLGFAAVWHRTHETDLKRVQDNPIWSTILADDRPINIVLGDYYLIGDTDDTVDVKRLIREFSVNSKTDLDRFLTIHPELASRYMDVGIRYLPVSIAAALRNVMVVLAPQERRVTVSKMSDLEPSSLKSADIIYIGFLSGMGMLQDFAFTGSGLAIGESYDEIVDVKTHHAYVSEVGDQVMHPKATGMELAYHDYGIFQKLRGPGGNTIVVIAGTRDEGVSQTAVMYQCAETEGAGATSRRHAAGRGATGGPARSTAPTRRARLSGTPAAESPISASPVAVN